MQVRVLGSGCASCGILRDRTHEALRQLGIEETVERVGDPDLIASYGIAETPALVVDGHVLFSGCLPDVPELVWAFTRSPA